MHPNVELAKFDFPQGVEDAIPAYYAELYRAVPLMLFEHSLVIAIDEAMPIEESARNIEFITGFRCEVFVAKHDEIDQAIDQIYSAEDLEGLKQCSNAGPEVEEVELLKLQVLEKPIVRIVTRMLVEAFRRGASDIHIRPTENAAQYYLRINGDMVLRSEIHKEHLNAVISRFKILGDMDISEHRQPQDGGAKVSVGGHKLELRLSVLPTIHGESLVVRLLNADKHLFTLAQLGLQENEYAHVFAASKQSHGLILAVGPTGSGKSTTLYAMLQEIRENEALNIITVEDPVEFHIEGTEQIQINRKAGTTFPKTLRNILRHDPDVIMVGEIRDEETAKIAIECALTGHLVLSTLHSINAVAAITRLVEMGVKPYLLKATLSLLVAQRLVRVNCPDCSVIDDSEEARLLGTNEELSHVKFHIGKGCEKCHSTGLSGRIGIYETLPVDFDLQQAIKDNVSHTELLEVCKRKGYTSLSEQALRLAEEGKISAREWIALQVG